MNYNIFADLQKDIQSFDNDIVTIASTSDENSVRYASTKTGGYLYSQKKVLNLIDLYYNSKFETGITDSEGMRKTFLNVCKFRADVAAKQTDLDVKNYVFIPDSPQYQWKTFFMARKFQLWTRDNDYGQLLNDLNKDYSKYGTCVTKRVGKRVERVPLRNLRVTQTAKSLKEAVYGGGYVIEEHEYSEYELKAFKYWDSEGMTYNDDGKCKVYERYALYPRSYVEMMNGRESNDDTLVPAMAIVAPFKKTKKPDGKILFIEEAEPSYAEAHWDKQDGRWLGIGEIENQFENQIARNFTANMRRRALLWGSKKIYQSTDDLTAKNLVRNVRDGEILKVGPNGAISQVNTGSQNLAEYSADEAMWEKNSDQKSFTFEVATGEALPSGTPFRLGVILSNSVASHFALKRQNFGLFLTRSFYNQLIPIFKKETKDHNVSIAAGAEGYEMLKESLVEYLSIQNMKRNLLAGNDFNPEEVKAKAEKEISREHRLFINIPAGFYDDAKFQMELDITGESYDKKEQIETLTTLYTSMVQRQDPRAEKVLSLILSKTGKNLEAILGKDGPQQINPQAIQGALQSTQSPLSALPQLNGTPA